jgi:hypothetical protein
VFRLPPILTMPIAHNPLATLICQLWKAPVVCCLLPSQSPGVPDHPGGVQAAQQEWAGTGGGASKAVQGMHVLWQWKGQCGVSERAGVCSWGCREGLLLQYLRRWWSGCGCTKYACICVCVCVCVCSWHVCLWLVLYLACVVLSWQRWRGE